MGGGEHPIRRDQSAGANIAFLRRACVFLDDTNDKRISLLGNLLRRDCRARAFAETEQLTDAPSPLAFAAEIRTQRIVGRKLGRRRENVGKISDDVFLARDRAGAFARQSRKQAGKKD